MTEQQIRDGFERLDSALAPPLDAADRVARRVAVRRRRRRAAVAGTAALVVVAGVGTAAALSGGDRPGHATAVDQPPATSTLVLTRPDGSTYAFPDVTVSCKPPQTQGGDRLEDDQPGRIWMYSPIEIEGSVDKGDAHATKPFVMFEGTVAKIEGDRTFRFPNDWTTPSDQFPMVLFVADTDGNEVASSAGGESGTVRVLEASCHPEPVLRLQVDMTLGSEVGEQSLDVTGELR